jgi:hypothetical protein
MAGESLVYIAAMLRFINFSTEKFISPLTKKRDSSGSG